MELLREIEGFLRRAGVSATRFGREATGDPRLVPDMRKGREPRPRTIARIRAHIAARAGDVR